MPIYEYVCRGCNNEFEALVRSDTVPACANCDSKQLDKMLSVFATAGSASPPMPAAAGPCGSCGNLRGPGGCALN